MENVELKTEITWPKAVVEVTEDLGDKKTSG